MSGGILCLGIDSLFVKACLCDQVAGHWRLVAWLDEQIPWDAQGHDLQVNLGPVALTPKVRWATDTLGQFLGCNLWEALARTPGRTTGESAASYAIDRVLWTLCPLPPLRVWVCTLTPLWLSALESLIHTVEAHLVGVTLLDRPSAPWHLGQDLVQGNPDLLIVCGGYDHADGARSSLEQMGRQLGACMAQLGAHRMHVVYAACHQAAQAFAGHLQAHTARASLTIVDNFMPHPEVVHGGPLCTALRDFRTRQLQEALDMEEARVWLQTNDRPRTHGDNFIRALRVWQGYHGLDAVHGVLHSGGNCMHVLLPDQVEDPVAIVHGPGLGTPDAIAAWPPVHLASGMPTHQPVPVPAPVCDPRGFMALTAPLFDIDPHMAWSIMTRDLLVQA